MVKKKNNTFFKPTATYVHPSLSSRENAASTPRETSSTSVSERIEHLRRVQGHDPSSRTTGGLNASRHAAVPSGRRQVAGPPPPRSWIASTEDLDEKDENDVSNRPRPRLSRLPGVTFPQRRSLVDVCLKSMATNIDWHTAFDHVYLSVLPIEIKVQLLSYIALHSTRGISRNGLEFLFLEPRESGLEQSTGVHEVTRIDLTCSIGRSIRFSELEKLWTRKRQQKHGVNGDDQLLESWEDDWDLNSLSLSPIQRFPNLTYLSLAHPPKNVSWQDLITFSSRLGSLTHLCLDFWPHPSLPEMQTATPREKSLYDHPVVRETDSSEREEAAIILRFLSRNTPALKWLSVAGCHSWYNALTPTEDTEPSTPRPRDVRPRAIDAEGASERALSRTNRFFRFEGPFSQARGPDWNGCWRDVRNVNVSQDWIPGGLKTQDLVPLIMHRKARAANREALRAEPFQPPREPETYRLSSTSDEVQRQIWQRLRKSRWLLVERMSIFLAASVDRKRLQAKLPTAEFVFGWGRPELLEAGYEEQLVFDAGL